MANICSNECHIQCDKNDVEIIKNYIKETFPSSQCYYENITEEECELEFDFDSRWDFPEKEMNKMITLLNEPESFSGSCLSVEWGSYYCAFHLNEGGEWYYQN